MVLVHRGLWEDVYTNENIDYQHKNNNLLSSTKNQNYYVDNCQFKSLPNRAIYLSTTSTSNKILISRSLFHACSVSNAAGGSLYIKGGSIVYYQICATKILINADAYTKGVFSYSESSKCLQILNYMNESTIAEGGNIDAGNSVDYRYNGNQHYKSNNCSNCISSYLTYDFRPENGLNLSYSSLFNTTTRGSSGLKLQGRYTFLMMKIMNNKCTIYNWFIDSYSSISIDNCIILDNTNPGTFYSPGVRMKNSLYNGDMQNVNEISPKKDLIIILPFLSTAYCHADNSLGIKPRVETIFYRPSWMKYYLLQYTIFNSV